ncbi:hypothetical protein [Kitasatospora purpeofusca]|uniref:hypothetical protein n=1 Tax=Kitasatospora purpeofusca TaxID=67352 RepID=UPI002251BCA1|nr:hypothetical protein [Kitasatospora purpeofusca]MCX4755123.1 hypothetical protein [Kitasatospora purpeofusca]WSR36983.1 hypothetical protein OG715_42110 [Kitasatospora purpeofusca]
MSEPLQNAVLQLVYSMRFVVYCRADPAGLPAHLLAVLRDAELGTRDVDGLTVELVLEPTEPARCRRKHAHL